MVGLSTKEIDERVTFMFQPDTVSPAQYLETVCRKTHLEAEQELMLVILKDAVICFQKYFAARDKIETRLFREAEEWILLQGKSDWLLSFDVVCENLDLNPGYQVLRCHEVY